MLDNVTNVNPSNEMLVIQQFTARGQIGRPPIETDFGPEIVLRGYPAEAMRLLIEANGGPVHVSEMRPDAPARLRQAGVRIRATACEDFGTGSRQCWIRLDGVRARIVREASMQDAA